MLASLAERARQRAMLVRGRSVTRPLTCRDEPSWRGVGGGKFFITQQFDWNPTENWKVGAVNRVLERWAEMRLTSPLASPMSTVEQRMNLYHFVSQVLAYGVPEIWSKWAATRVNWPR